MSAKLPNSSRIGAIALIAMVTSACGGEPSSGELREWRASDHQLPEGMDDSDPDPVTAADPGAALYATHCASCHGASGRGDGPGAPPMARVASFADPAIQARTDEELTQVIVAGRGGFMPAFGDRLAGPGIAAIVRHLRSFAR
jgi:mono/diheme cytochrome c family protein